MYKRAARRTGGSKLNGRALLASSPSNPKIEIAASRTSYVRRMVLNFDINIIGNLSDYDITLIIIKIIDEGYSIDRNLLNLYPSIQKR